MLTTTALLLGGGLFGQLFPLPTSEDHLKAPPGERRVAMILDSSGSMADGPLPQAFCTDFLAKHCLELCGACPFDPSNPACTTELSKNQQLRAAALGCVTGTDGIFDRWAGRVDFTVLEFGETRVRVLPEIVTTWTRNTTLLETAVDNLPASGGTPLAWALLKAGQTHQYWTNAVAGTNECDQHFNILLTDGMANNCSGSCISPDFNFRCDGTTLNPDDNEPVSPEEGAKWSTYSYNTAAPPTYDSVCSLNGSQQISTYTIGFGAAGSFDPSFLSAVASAGGGKYYIAGDAAQLASTFDQILQSIVDRDVVFSAPSVLTDGLFIGNTAYASAFRPRSSKPWVGNLKKYCVVPALNPSTGRYIDESAAGGKDCLFKSVAGSLVTNPEPLDQYTGTRSLDATVGGAGQNIYRDYLNNTTPLAPVSWSDYWTRRKVMTWDEDGYKLANPTTLSGGDLLGSGCLELKIFAYLHGYDPESVDCTNKKPTKVAAWPFGAVVNSNPVFLRWDKDCTAEGRCVTVVGADDSMLHFIDAFSGRELFTMVPGDKWKPKQSASYPIAKIFDTPTSQLTRRPYVDGGVVRYHDDKNGNGVIDSGEQAMLVYGVGKGGRGYFFMDVSKPFPGPSFLPTTADHKTYPLIPVKDVWSQDLRHSIAKPTIGRVKVPSVTSPITAAVFGSGNVWYLDSPLEAFNVDAAPLPKKFDVDDSDPDGTDASGEGKETKVDCTGGAGFAANNGYAPPSTLCSASYISGCAGTAAKPCYDFYLSGGLGVPFSQVFGPFKYQKAGEPPASILTRFAFKEFDLGPDDSLTFEDASGNPWVPAGTGTAWDNKHVDVFAPSGQVYLRFRTNGLDSNNKGWVLDHVHYLEESFWLGGNCPDALDPCKSCDLDDDGDCDPASLVPECLGLFAPVCAACDVNNGDHKCNGAECYKGKPCKGDLHNPFVVAIDLNGFPADSAFDKDGHDADDAGALIFTRKCAADFKGTCYDATTYPDLAYMRCPISAEVRAFEEGGLAKRYYVGDECGNLWKFWTADSGTSWKAKRILTVDELDVQGLQSRQYRKFTRAVDLSVASCAGGRSVGIYFGTGNLARPGALDNLPGVGTSAIRPGYNVVGAFFDDGSYDTGASATLAALKDVTPATAGEAPKKFSIADSKRGYFWALGPNEQMLRDPLIFTGTAYYKTNTGLTAASRCTLGTTRDQIYAINACSAAPANGGTTAGDRIAWSGSTDVGGNIFVYTPKSGAPIVSAGDQKTPTPNIVPPKAGERTLRLYLWWRG